MGRAGSSVVDSPLAVYCPSNPLAGKAESFPARSQSRAVSARFAVLHSALCAPAPVTSSRTFSPYLSMKGTGLLKKSQIDWTVGIF